MLWTCIKKELLQIILTRKFQVCLFISLILLGVSLYVSTEQYIFEKSAYDAEIAAQQRGVNAVLAVNEDNVDEFDYYALVETVFRKPTPMSIFCYGREGDFGTQVLRGNNLDITLFAQPAGEGGDSSVDVVQSLKDSFEHIDMVFCIKIILSLMVVFLAFDLISGEREADTLKMVHAGNVSRLTVIMSKCLAGAVIIGVVILGMMLVSLLYILLIQHIAFDYRIFASLLMLYAASIVYLMLFYQLTLLFSVNARTSKQVVVSMFIAWCLVCFILPMLGAETGKQVLDVPSWTEMLQMSDEAFNREYEKVNDNENRQQSLDRQYRAVSSKRNILYSYLDRLRKQGRNANLLAMISPAHMYQVISERISGTAVEDYEAFMSRARQEFDLYWAARSYKDTSNETMSEGIKIVTDLNISLYDASRNDNRLSLSNSIPDIVRLLIPMIVANGMLFLMTILWYDRKPVVL